MSKYNIKHKRQSSTDFKYNCHRFSFWYNYKKIEASCYNSDNFFFSDENIPEEVKNEIKDEIRSIMGKEEFKISFSNEIATNYV